MCFKNLAILNTIKIQLYFLILFFTVSGCNKVIKGDIVISNINIIDVSNSEIKPSQDVIIEGATITRVLPHEPNIQYESPCIIDGSGKFLTPGLMDMHTHVLWHIDDFSIQNKMMIANGVTGFRDMWGSDSIAKIVKDKMKLGEFPNQRIYRTNHMIDGPPEIWEGSGEVASPEKAIQFVDSIVQHTNADFIKVYSLLSKESFMAIAKRCKELNIDFAGHIPYGVPLEDAISSGMRSIEHLYGFQISLSKEKDKYFKKYKDPSDIDFFLKTVFSQSNERIDTIAALLNQNNTFVVPTFTIHHGLYKANSETPISESKYSEFIPDYRREKWKITYEYADSIETKLIERDYEIIGLLNERGVKIIAGTDVAFVNPFTFAGFSIHDELQYLVSAGLTPSDALKASTIYAAELIHKEDSLGQIKKGYFADLVLLDKNPLVKIGNTKTIHSVISNGILYNSDSLQMLLKEAKEITAKLEMLK